MGSNLNGVKYFDQHIFCKQDLSLGGKFNNRILNFGGLELKTNAKKFKSLFTFHFPGTDVMDVNNIKVTANSTKGESYSLRIYDFTNNQEIAKVTGLTNENMDIIDLGAIANLPTSDAIFELQAQIDGANTHVYVYGITIV